ncbi:MAG TPA: ABC transporter permease [Alphaproteobacteria bacterium]|jgi:peptide/nickel transport system permease protein
MPEAALPAEGAGPAIREEGGFVRFWREFRESRLAVAALLGVVIVVLAALLAPVLAPQNPYDLRQLDILANLLAPGSQSGAGYTHWLGTDDQGRDMLSGILYGLRISLGVGVASGAIALLVGMTIGLFAAYAGGRVEAFVMRVVDVQLSFPAVLVALILLAVLGRGAEKIVLALVIVQWAYYARTVRASAIVELNKEYVAAARCLALSPVRILFRHILPNCLPPLLVVGTIQTAHAIALEATLSFVGVGMPLTEPSLGRLIANGYQYMLSGKYWISVFPGLALLVAIASINLVGDQLRDILNPRLRR